MAASKTKPSAENRKRESASRNARVDQRFYEQVREANGGELPADLVGQDGKPRKLTRGPKDVHYRDLWHELEAADRAQSPGGKVVGGATQPCPKQAVDTRANRGPKREPCKHGALTVICKHGRKIELSGQAGSGAQDSPCTLEVVAGDVEEAGLEEIKAATTMEGPCKAIHKGRVLDIQPEPGYEPAVTDTSLTFRPSCWPIPEGLAALLPSRLRVKEYRIALGSCDGERHLAKVRVYPDIGWEASVGVEYKEGWQRKRLDGLEAAGKGRSWKGLWDRLFLVRDKDEDESSLNLTWSMSRRHGSLPKTEWGAEFEAKRGRLSGFISLLSEVSDFLFYGLASLTGTVIELETGVSVQGSWGWKELDDWRCGMEVDIGFKMSPLFKVSVEQDVTDAILLVLGAASGGSLVPILTRVKNLRDAAARGVGSEDGPLHAKAEGKITLKVGGAISAEGHCISQLVDGKWSMKESGQSGDLNSTSVDVAVSGAVTVELEGALHGKGKAQNWWFEAAFEAGASLGAEAGLEMSDLSLGVDGGRMLLGVKIQFTGLVVKGVALVQGSLRLGEEEPEGGVEHGVAVGVGKETVTAALNDDGEHYDKKVVSGKGEVGLSRGDKSVEASAGCEGNIEYMCFPPKTWDFSKSKLCLFD